MKIAIASLGDPRSVNTWSGIPAHIVRALEKKGHDLVGIALSNPEEPWYFDWLRRLYWWLQKKWFLSAVEKTSLKAIGKQLDTEVAVAKPDAVLIIHGDFLAYTTFSQPACIIHDTTFASILDYYPAFSNLTLRSIKAGNQMYKLALNRADAAFFSSEWASESAIHDYQTNISRVYTIPFGANLNNIPENDFVIKCIKLRSQSEDCKLIFLGIDWERKGGADALRFVIELNRLGIKSRLLIVGCKPQLSPDTEQFVEKMGFFNKSVEAEAKKLEALLQESHALILPSKAECYGCVYCEANAYGLPALARDTGGVSEIIKDGVNGLLLKIEETPEMLAERWAIIWRKREIYTSLAITSRNEYEKRLNYDVFATKVESILNDLIVKAKQ